MRHANVAALAFACLMARPADAQQVLVGTTKNRAVEPIVAEISAARIEATIRKLASFTIPDDRRIAPSPVGGEHGDLTAGSM